MALYGQYQIPNWPNVNNQDGQYTFIIDQLNQPDIRAVSSPFTLTGTGNAVNNQIVVGRSNPYYTVQTGETLSSVAAKFGTTPDILLALNPAIGTSGVVFPGQLIYLPAQ
jgi:LysM repeat protein